MTQTANLPYPENFLCDLFGTFEWELPEDCLATIEYVWSTVLPKDMYRIMKMRYRDGDTLEVIGQEFNLSRERVRQKIHKTLRHLLRQPYRKQLKMGMQQWHQMDLQELQRRNMTQIQEQLQERLYEIVNAESTQFVTNLLGKFMTLDTTDMGRKIEVITQHPMSQNLILEEMGLSVRSYNALKHCKCVSGDKYIQTSDDIAQLGERRMKEIRNLGAKSYDEILQKLRELGYRM